LIKYNSMEREKCGEDITKIKYTRKEYLEGKASFEEYYRQFVNEEIKTAVINRIGIERILMSKDEHLNDIPLREWDDIAGFKFYGSRMVESPSSIPWNIGDKLECAGEGFSSATATCILKQASRMLKEYALIVGKKNNSIKK